jgi:hypothetical protein
MLQARSIDSLIRGCNHRLDPRHWAVCVYPLDLSDRGRSSLLEPKKGGRIVTISLVSQRVKATWRQFSLRTLIFSIVAFALLLAFINGTPIHQPIRTRGKRF